MRKRVPDLQVVEVPDAQGVPARELSDMQRAERIERVIEAVRQGTYKVRTELMAEKLVSRIEQGATKR